MLVSAVMVPPSLASTRSRVLKDGRATGVAGMPCPSLASTRSRVLKDLTLVDDRIIWSPFLGFDPFEGTESLAKDAGNLSRRHAFLGFDPFEGTERSPLASGNACTIAFLGFDPFEGTERYCRLNGRVPSYRKPSLASTRSRVLKVLSHESHIIC